MSIDKWVRFAEFKPAWFSYSSAAQIFVDEMHGERAWSDGSLMMLGDPPMSEDPPTKDFSAVVAKCDREAAEIQPLAVARIPGEKTLLFLTGGIAIQLKLYRLVAEKFPDATWHGDSRTENVVARCGTKAVAFIMPYKTYEIADEVLALLDSKSPQPPQTLLES